MTVSDLVYRRALAMLWSAGHEPTRSQRMRMQGDAYKVGLPDDWLVRKEALNESAARLLAMYGYAADPTRAYDEALPEVQSIHRYAPLAGHAVRIEGDGGWMGVKRGDVLVLSSCDERRRLRVGRGRHYRTEEGAVSLSSGGPGSIVGLRTEVLVPTSETIRIPFWRFHLSPEANGGVDFTRPAPVWTWDGDEAAFREPMAEAA